MHPAPATPSAPPSPVHVGLHSGAHVEPEARLARLVAEIGARLRPVCSAMPPAEFDALVRDIARMKLRWSAQD